MRPSCFYILLYAGARRTMIIGLTSTNSSISGVFRRVKKIFADAWRWMGYNYSSFEPTRVCRLEGWSLRFCGTCHERAQTPKNWKDRQSKPLTPAVRTYQGRDGKILVILSFRDASYMLKGWALRNLIRRWLYQSRKKTELWRAG